MRLSEAFKLLEDGEILTDGRSFMGLNKNKQLVHASYARDILELPAGVGEISESVFNNFHVYEKPKEKVQYFQVMYRGVSGEICIDAELYETENGFKDKPCNKNVTLIQLVKFGDPI